jgi:hypothetical protein
MEAVVDDRGLGVFLVLLLYDIACHGEKIMRVH